MREHITGDQAAIQYMVSRAHLSVHPKLHLDQFSHFSTARDYDQQTDTQATLLL